MRHLPVLRRIPGVEIAAICDSDRSKAQALAGRFDIPEAYDDIEDVLRYVTPDAVVICTPNHLHEIHVVAALSAGVHVLCERPLALSQAGVERVLQAAERYGRRVMVAMNHRFRADVQAIRGFLAGGELGTIDMIRGGWFTFQPSATRQQLGWRLRRAEAGGGAMLDLGLPDDCSSSSSCCSSSRPSWAPPPTRARGLPRASSSDRTRRCSIGASPSCSGQRPIFRPSLHSG